MHTVSPRVHELPVEDDSAAAEEEEEEEEAPNSSGTGLLLEPRSWSRRTGTSWHCKSSASDSSTVKAWKTRGCEAPLRYEQSDSSSTRLRSCGIWGLLWRDSHPTP